MKIIPALTVLSLLAACHPNKDQAHAGHHPAILREISVKNLTPTVDISKYALVDHPAEDRAAENRAADAEEILKLKRKWPLVMQSPAVAAFDSILAADFVFVGDGQLLNRSDYIEDRTNPSEWKITHVVYDNLTLQFFGDIALLTYRNRVTNEHIVTKTVETEYISWADVYKKENGQWKIGAAHVVDFRLE